MPSLDDLFGLGRGGERIYHGADDNASGSAALLEVAKAFSKLAPAPRRQVVFVWFDGEERGLWGSRHYVAEPILPLGRCAGMVNMDQVGRSRGGRVELIGANSGEGLVEMVEAENRAVGLDLVVDPYMVPNSDHFPFFERGVPVAFFFTGLHLDYHRPSDEWQRVNADDMARVARLAFRTAAHLANARGRPALEPCESAPLPALVLEFAHGATGSKLLESIQRDGYGGIAGAFVKGGSGGLDVTYVVPNSAADSAGLRRGDELLSLNGRPATRLRFFLAARRGGKVQVEFSRAGEKRTAEVELAR
jgi:hypothetical protein